MGFEDVKSSGFTLIELLVVISIICILAVATGFSYNGWQARYNVENEIKQIQADLRNARSSAIGGDRDFFVDFSCNGGSDCTSYSVYEDTNTAPDGNCTLENTGSPQDKLITTKTLRYPVTWAGNLITYDGRGIVTPDSGVMVVTSSTNANTTKNPDYDCILFTALKTNEGKWNTSSGTCDVK